VSRWQLLDFFLVLIITIAAWRLFGSAAGVIALLALVLSYHEFNAPAWLWLNVLITVALMRVAPPGRLRHVVQAYQGISVAILVLVLVPFIAGQLRIAIFPQLEPQYGAGYGISPTASEDLPPAAPMEGQLRRLEAVPVAERYEPADAAKGLVADAPEVVALSSVAMEPQRRYSRYAPNAVVQAGPGVPSWQWNSYWLSWSGPVDAGQAMRLVVLPRWAVTSLRFVEVALLLLFAAVMAAEILRKRWILPGGTALGTAKTAALHRHDADPACRGRSRRAASRVGKGLASAGHSTGWRRRGGSPASGKRGVVVAPVTGQSYGRASRRRAAGRQSGDSVPDPATRHRGGQ
jgi:hypothetical protein